MLSPALVYPVLAAAWLALPAAVLIADIRHDRGQQHEDPGEQAEHEELPAAA
jgi:hypothetical protein